MAVRKVDWVQKVVESFRQTLRNASGYRKYGLRAEDTLSEEDPDVAEGIKKLPKEEYLLRLERLRRANDLSMKHRILARDQWTKPEEDISYLSPYIKIACQERLERLKWDE